MNCSFLAAQASEHTLSEIGRMMGISRERVRQIESIAIKKLKVRLEKRGIRYEFEHQQGLVGRGSPNTPEAKKPVRIDKTDSFYSFSDGELDIQEG